MTNTIFLCALLAAGVASIANVVNAIAVVEPKSTASFAVAPKITASVYEEAMPMLYASKLVYNFADIVVKARERDITLELPDDFPLDDLSRFASESVDLRDFNDGNGLSFSQLDKLLEKNKEVISAMFEDKEFEKSLVRNLKNARTCNGEDNECGQFLATYRSIQADISCVYGVVKDKDNKRIVLSFRGSKSPFSNRDWKTNLNAKLVEMRTPKKIKDQMKGKLQKRVLVHRGFFNYLFNNKRVDGDQRYDRILEDIEPLMEEGYSFYVTGHSLGGALAHMFSFKLAGAGPKRDWVPRPLTCITYAAPFSGSSGYRAAFEQEEQAGLIRCLRVTNGEDVIPASPPGSLGIPIVGSFRSMKHTGINLRLTKYGMKLRHSSVVTLWNAVSNSIFKPVWKLLDWHGLALHEGRMKENKDALSAVTLDGLYKDAKVTNKSFIKGEVTQHIDDEDEDEL